MRLPFLTLHVAIGFLLATGVIHAHPGDDHPPDMRVWKDADGLFEIEASFVQAQGDRVQLLRHDRTLVWVPLDKLGTADQAWVRDRVEMIRLLNGGGSTQTVTLPQVGPSAPAGSSGVAPWLIAAWTVSIAFVAAALKSIRRKLALIPAVAAACALASLSLLEAGEQSPTATIQKHFEPFKRRLAFRSDADYFYVGSNGLPEHPMLAGIKAWNQQVPLPQPYTGSNAFRIPLRPRLADNPVSGKESFFKGAIAVAVNGVPIFNPIKQDGRTDTFLGGELDEFGGHCGRADDYHYHIAPIHLEKFVGKGQPIAYALDGFPLLGYTDAAGIEPKNLDAFNGRTDADGQYRYYSTKAYPYVNGGLRGVVEIKNGEVAVQPRAAPVRPFLPGLKGTVKIDSVTLNDGKGPFVVKYDYQGDTRTIAYTINPGGSYTFTFVDAKGNEKIETYTRKDGKADKQDDKGPPMKDDGKEPEEKKKDAKKKDDKGPRMPWLAAHFEELDTNKDGSLSADELKEEVAKVFKLFDNNGDGKLTKDEYDVPRPDVKSSMAGFVRSHAEEIDANRDGILAREELQAVMTRMFERADRKGAGRISREDAAGK